MSVGALKSAGRDAAAQGFPFLDNLPVAVLLCDPASGVVTYANRQSLTLLKRLEALLPVRPEALVGGSAEVLFKAHPVPLPSFLAVASKLPERLVLKLGDETLEVKANPVYGRKGEYAHAQLTWDVVTEAARDARRAEDLFGMLEEVPVNVMTCSLEDFRIDYANRASRETFKRLAQYLPVKADAVVGSTIDIFHKHPHVQQRLLANPSNLPHSALIHIGPEVLDLRMSAVTAADGRYLKPMVTWSVATDRVKLAREITDVGSAMAATAAEMQGSSARLLELTEGSAQTSVSVSAAAVQMSASFDEINRRIAEMTGLSGEVTDKAVSADRIVAGLSESMERIGKVTALIEKIAGQTNLLALNATIEAARVGEWGRGFAVVAQEVKALAVQTAAATQDIRRLVGAVQDESQSASSAVSEITIKVRELSEAFTLVSAGVEQQAATNRSVSHMISGVSDAAAETRQSAMVVRRVAGEVSGFATRLNEEVGTLLKK
ncbi:methyl-accepting chemotaxis protein [Xanthobacter sp. V4C-4]|uniref:methyl-accepting chemotaxis protein n=1 Tax=Xanthobacter cornucopiae TaxID=3119924 RepID=UPI00372725D3